MRASFASTSSVPSVLPLSITTMRRAQSSFASVRSMFWISLKVISSGVTVSRSMRGASAGLAFMARPGCPSSRSRRCG